VGHDHAHSASTPTGPVGPGVGRLGAGDGVPAQTLDQWAGCHRLTVPSTITRYVTPAASGWVETPALDDVGRSSTSDAPRASTMIIGSGRPRVASQPHMAHATSKRVEARIMAGRH
jgi:hypothetical protein